MHSSDELLLKGLSQSEAESRLLQYGPNTLPVAKKPGLLQIFLHQYKRIRELWLCKGFDKRLNALLFVALLICSNSFRASQGHKAG